MKLGELLIQQGLATQADIDHALERQQENGGRIGEILVAMGVIDQAQLDHMFEYNPPAPKTIADTGLSTEYLIEHLLKTIYETHATSMNALADVLKLPGSVVNLLLEEGIARQVLEGKGSQGGGFDMRVGLTERGRAQAMDAFHRSQYVGPVPVPFEAYRRQIDRQRISNEKVTYDDVTSAFAGIVVPEQLLLRLGPAINSARALLMYGPPGNGKTTIAEAISRMFRQTVFIPYAFEVDGAVIKVFDPAMHRPVKTPAKAADASISIRANSLRQEEPDPRWVACQRPLLITGGELTLDMLDMSFNPVAKYYEAPLQLKATNGIFIIDDFGRQIVRPKDLLNRWIVPLEQRVDYLTLHTGKKFPVTFDELVIFSTNFPPQEMMDGAMLRRIPYKIEITPPERGDYERIFRIISEKKGLELPDGLLEHLFATFYEPNDAPLACYHPNFLIDQAIAQCKFEGVEPHLSRELVDKALCNLQTAY